MCNQVVAGENGTGKTARPAGYLIGGKTGTAQTLPRGNGEYVVSFLGYAPAQDPQIAVYVVVDRPNTWGQDDAKFATRIVRSVMTEVLPYLGIFMTEELSEKEKNELAELQLEITTPTVTEEESAQEEESVEEAPAEEVSNSTPIWKTFKIDAATGYAVDPNTGGFVDPDTGASIGYTMEEYTGGKEDDDSTASDGDSTDADEDKIKEIENENGIGVAGEGIVDNDDSPW